MIYYPLLDTKKNIQKLQEHINNNPALFTDDITQATAILVAGGDGFMLHMLKEYQTYELPFVGVNFGRLGFLMNDFADYSMLPKSIEELDIVTEQLPHVTAIDAAGKEYTTHMVNDLAIGKAILDYFYCTVHTSAQTYHVQGTGLLLSTAIGSTAYWLSNGGPVIPLSSNIWGIMGIATMPFHHQLVQPSTITIDIESKSEAEIGVDGHSRIYTNIKRVIISPDTTSVRLGFIKTHNFDTKRLLIAEHKSMDISA